MSTTGPHSTNEVAVTSEGLDRLNSQGLHENEIQYEDSGGYTHRKHSCNSVVTTGGHSTDEVTVRRAGQIK